MGSQKGLFGTLLMVAGTVMAIVNPAFGIPALVWSLGAIGATYVGSLLAQAALKDQLEAEQRTIQSTLSGTQVDLPIIYGTDVKVGSVIADAFTYGTKGEFLYLVSVLGVTPDNGQGLEAVKFMSLASEGGTPLSQDPVNGSPLAAGHTGSGGKVSKRYEDNYWYNIHNGEALGVVDPLLNTTVSSAWPTSSKGYGLAYVVHKFEYDYADDEEKALFSTLPDIRYVVDGNKVADFREDPVTYGASNNPVLNLYDYLTSERYGLGIDPSEINTASFEAAADYCDGTPSTPYIALCSGSGLNVTAGYGTFVGADPYANTSLTQLYARAKSGDTLRITSGVNAGDYTIAAVYSYDSSGDWYVVIVSPAMSNSDTNMSWELIQGKTLAPYAASGVLLTGSGHKRNIESLLISMRAQLYWQDGQFYIWIRQPETAETFELNADTNIESISITRPGTTETPNVIECSFLNPNKDWTVDTLIYPDPGDTNPYLAEDNGVESRLVIELPLASEPRQVLELIEVMLKEARTNTMVEVVSTEAALQLSVGDVVKLTDDSAGWTGKEFWVMSLDITQDNKIKLLLQEYDVDVYTSIGTYLPGQTPGTDLPSPTYVPAPTNVTAVSDQTTYVVQADGTVLQYIKLTWTQSPAFNLDYEEVFYKKTSDTYYTHWNRTYQNQVSKEELIGPVETGVEYTVGVQAVNTLGLKSELVTDAITPEAKGEPPSDITTLTATPTCRRETILDWDDSTDTDVVRYEVRYGGTDWATSTYYATVSSSILLVPSDDTPARSTNWRVKAIDTTGNESTNDDAELAVFSTVQAVDPLDLTVQSRNGVITVTVPVGGASPLNATELYLWASLTNGFTPSDSNLVATKTLRNCSLDQTELSFSIPSGWDGETVYMKVGSADYLTDVLSESVQISTQFTDTGADPTGGDVVIAPAVQETWSYAAGVITLTLAIDDPQSRLSGTRFRDKDGLVNGWGSWTEDLTDPYNVSYDVNLVGASADVYVEWQIDYANSTGTSTIGNVVTVDADRIPRAGFTPQVDSSGNVTLAWNSIDDDLTGIKALASTSGFPSDASVQAASEDTLSPTGTLVTLASSSEVAYIKAFPYNNVDSLYGAVFTATTRLGDAPGYPVVEESVEENTAAGTGTVSLKVTSPQGDNLTVEFFEKAGPGAFPGTADQSATVTSGDTETYVATLDEAKNVYVKYTVANSVGTVGGVVVFDPDKIPNLQSTGLDIDELGNVTLTWTGDSDLLSIRYHYAISSTDDPKDFTDVTDPTSTGNSEDGRYGDALLTENGTSTEVVVEQGETIYVKVRGFNAISGGGDYGELALLKATRQVDTSNASNLINNGDFESGLAYWGGIRYIGSGPIYTLYTTTSTGAAISGTSLEILGQPGVAVNVITATSQEGFDNCTILVAEGDRIDVGAEAYVSGSHTLTMYVRWYDSSKTIIGSQTSILTWTETSATPKSTSVVAPTNAVYCGFAFNIPADATDSKYAIVDNVYARYKVSFSDYQVSSLGDVASYSANTGQVLTWTAGGEWDAVDADNGAYNEVAINAFTTTTPRQILRLIEGSGINLSINDDSGNDETEITITGDFTGLDADTLDTYHASAFARKAEAASIGGEWSYTAPIKLTGGSNERWLNIFNSDNAFDTPAGLQWFGGSDESAPLFRTMTDDTDADLHLQYYNGSWASSFEVDQGTGVVDFKSNPTVNGNTILTTASSIYYQTVAIEGFATATQRDTLRLIGGTNISMSINDDAGNSETEVTVSLSGTIAADTLGGYSASDFAARGENEVISGEWDFTAPIAFDGGSNERWVNFHSAAQTFENPMGIQFFGTTDESQPMYRTMVDANDHDLHWQYYNSGWSSSYEIDQNTGKVDFKTTPSVNGTNLLTSVGNIYYQYFRRDSFSAMAQRETLHLIGGTNITISATDDSGNDETDITIALDATGLDADTLDTYHASSFPRKAEAAIITGEWDYTHPIAFDGGTNERWVNFHLGTQTFENAMGIQFFGTVDESAPLYRTMLDANDHDFHWQYYNSGWSSSYEIDQNTGKVDFKTTPSVNGTNLLTSVGSLGPLSDHSDVDTGYAVGDILYYGTSWSGQSPSEIGLVTDTDISVQQADSHKGYLGPNDINFEAGSGASVNVVDEGSKITVTYSVTGGTATNLVSSGSAYVQIDSDSSGTADVFEVRCDSATPGAGTILLQVEQPVSSNATIETYGTILKLGSLNTSVTGNDIVITGDSTYATFEAAGGQAVQLEVQAVSDEFWLYNGTSRNRIAPIYGWATGTGSPGAVAAVKGALYFRYT